MIKSKYSNDAKMYKNFGQFHVFYADLKPLLTISILAVAVGLIFLVLHFMYDAINIWVAIISFLFAFAVPIIKWLSVRSKINERIKKSPNFYKICNYYDFNEKDFNLKITNGKREENHTYKYTDMYKIYETKSVFYFYLNKESALIIPKNEFFDGTAEQLREIIKNNLSNKTFKQIGIKG